MIIPKDPRDLALDLLPRSICLVQVAAAIADDGGIFSWGWNSVGSGYGEHAEMAAIRRSNRDRLRGATIYVASQRNRNGKVVNSRPCDNCARVINKYGMKVWFRDGAGEWVEVF